MEEGPGPQRPVVVAIGGFLCGGGDVNSRKYSFWGIPAAALQGQGFRVVTVSPSPVGSLHDRACQIFYELKGGTVCYGREHSRAHGHACHGETYDTGSLSAWGEDNPVHLIGHSFGGQTARVLQHLVATGFFSKPGEYETSAAWIRSVTACNSPLNGSLLVYSLGERAHTAPAVRLGSHGHLLSVAIHAVELLDWAFLRSVFDPRLSHFKLSRRCLGWRRACLELARAVAGDSVIFARPDNAAFDMTVHSAHRYNQEIRTDPDTFYFSLVGTRPDPPRGPKLAATCAPGGRTGWTLWDWARLVTPNTSLKGLLTRLVYWVLRRLHVWQVRGHEREVESRFGVAADAWSSFGHDGVLEAFTQSHPRVPEGCETPVSFGLPGCQSTLKPGVWHCQPVNADHMWAHADGTHARDAFERLAHTLRLVADSGLPRYRSSASRVREPRGANLGLRRSPRLLLKAQRAGLPAATAMARSDAGGGEVLDGVFEGEFLSGRRSHGVGNARRCDICATGAVTGVGGRGREIDDISGRSGDGVEPFGGGLLPRRFGFWKALVFFALLLLGSAFLLWPASPARTSPVLTTEEEEEPCALGEHALATVELVGPLEGPKESLPVPGTLPHCGGWGKCCAGTS